MPQSPHFLHFPPVPLDSLRPAILHALQHDGRLTLTAPPGTGKSSRLPLWLLQPPWPGKGKIYLLEPRRMAARALARYMAGLLGEQPGQTVGWRMRGENVCSADTRIEVLTEGVLTRILQADPELSQASCIIFDEFHERSLQSDLALALCLESRAALRPDLRLVVMSATLDGAAVAKLMGHCPFLSCDGQSFPVETRWLPPRRTDLSPGPELWRHTAAVICDLLRTESGSLLVFLPGIGEIRQTAALLEDRLPPQTSLHLLYGSLSASEQDAAISPAPSGKRKVVLATSIAETSLTIEGIRLVVDAGLARRSRFDPACGMNRLVTERVSLAGAAQRRGRAGRLNAGICCRLWSREEESAMRQQSKAEILESDLEELVLQLAHWGVSTVQAIQAMAWLDAPPTAALLVARRHLAALGALDDQGRITPVGRHMVALPTQPRLARMLLYGKERNLSALACCLAALMEERDPLWKNGQNTDSHLELRLDWLCCKSSPEVERLRAQAQRFAQLLHLKEDIFAAASRQRAALGQLIALAWPLWTAQRQRIQNGKAVYLLRQGKTAVLPLTDSLAHTEYLAVASLAGAGAHGKIRLAAPLSLAVLEELFAPQISDVQRIDISEDGQVCARRQQRLDSLLLQESPLPRPDPSTCAQALCDFLHQGGLAALAALPWHDTARQWQARILLLRELEGDSWPDVTDAALLERLEDWLAPALIQPASLRTLSPEQLYNALRTLLPPQQACLLDKAAPCRWQAPSGAWHPIVYGDAGGPWMAAKLQEFFGCEQGPIIANGRIAVTLHLNSPAGRPLQITRDLRHFWRNGYASVRAEMRGRYPKHPWPEDPLSAAATILTKKKLERVS